MWPLNCELIVGVKKKKEGKNCQGGKKIQS